MGLISRVIGGAEATRALGDAAQGVAEVFVPSATERMVLSAAAHRAALDSHSEEFRHIRPGLFDRLVNGLNRVPRPMLALGTLGLFVYAMVDPASFATRMVGLAEVPEPLWWLLGAIVSFYFGAREMHYFRSPEPRGPRAGPPPRPLAEDNPALSAWRNAAAHS
ncbi:methionine synthase I [Rhodophyticola sp. CCM32]|uniref:holin family protein n=1 Tax=Rhodophyticola sp. CCM32 TaxID=2916397 RepID=UPI00107EE9B0|nr:holin family protein [Rhodophyticola sp. CCM32]QBY00356.1 methionine synthase I [Rhodophyticola sp. CCM32]